MVHREIHILCTFLRAKGVQMKISMTILEISRNFVHRVWQTIEWCVLRMLLYSVRIRSQGHKVHDLHTISCYVRALHVCDHAYKTHQRIGQTSHPKSLKILLASRPSMSFTNSVVYWAIPPP
jgi:hypothetical protein